MSEYIEIIKQYPNIDFIGDINKRNKNYSLFQLEAANIAPQNYFTGYVKQYKQVYTWNSKLYSDYKNIGINVIKIPNFPLFDNYYNLDSYFPYKDKIDGICLVCRYRNKSAIDFDISYSRIEVFEELEGIEKHCYGKIPYCGDYYKGVIGITESETYPSSSAKLKLLNKYKFNLCFENCYHKYWSVNYITEKIIDCFKAKTIPIYWGCYDIDEHIPPELYIDYRKYSKNLVEHLKSITEEQYIEMTEKAFEWEKKRKLGDVQELKTTLDKGVL